MASLSPLAHALNSIISSGRSTVAVIATNARPVLQGGMASVADLTRMQTINTRLLTASDGLQAAIQGALKVQQLPTASRALLEESSVLLRTRHTAALTQLQGNAAHDLRRFGAHLYDESQRSIEIARHAWQHAGSAL